MNNEPLGWAQITHPFHPLRGKRFLILKIRRYGGVETVSLQGARYGTFAVPIEHLGVRPPILDFRSVLDLVDLVQQLKGDTKMDRHTQKGVDK